MSCSLPLHALSPLYFVGHLFLPPGFACLLLSAPSEFSIFDKCLWVDIYEQKRVVSLEWGCCVPLNRLTFVTQKCLLSRGWYC